MNHLARSFLKIAKLLLCVLPLVAAAGLRADLLFTNVNVFDGKTNGLLKNHYVLVRDGLITKVSADEIVSGGAEVIDGQGLTLMPGLIDVHTHLALNDRRLLMESDYTLDYIAIRAAKIAERALLDGFTSVRDLGGPVFGVRRAIEDDLILGPRIFPSGAILSQSSGHGDFRARADPNPTLTGERVSNYERWGISSIVDGRPLVLAATRQNLMQGATQIKIMAGGGGSSVYDPIDTTQFTEDEMRAAVEAAADWGTYVTAHLFFPRAARRAIEAGVKCLDHAFFLDEATIELAVSESVFLAPQFWAMSTELFKHPDLQADKHDAIRALQAEAKNLAPWLVKHGAKVPFATDLLGIESEGTKSRRFEMALRVELFGSNLEVLRQMTSVAGELLALSGPRFPAPGPLGVIAEGATADILLIDGNPLEDIDVLGAHSEWFDAPDPEPIDTIRLIMKGGVIYKNTLAQ